jgi:hypothetical protein
MKVVGCEANLVDFAFLFESSGIKKVLEDSFIVASFQIFTEAPAMLPQSCTANFCVLRTTKSIDALMHGDVAFMDLANKLNGLCGILCEILGDKG